MVEGRDVKHEVAGVQIVDRSVGQNEEMENVLDGNEAISDESRDEVTAIEISAACMVLA